MKQLVAGSPRYYLLTQFLYYGPAVLNISPESVEELPIALAEETRPMKRIER